MPPVEVELGVEGTPTSGRGPQAVTLAVEHDELDADVRASERPAERFGLCERDDGIVGALHDEDVACEFSRAGER